MTTEVGLRIFITGVAEARRAVTSVDNDIAKLEGTIRSLSGAAAGVGTSLTNLGNAISTVGKNLSLSLTAPLALLAKEMLEAGIAFEDTFATIARTVEGVVDPMGNLTEVGRELRDEFRQMALEIPIAGDELNELGGLVGQLGIETGSIENVTRLIAMLGATTEISAEEAAKGIIRFGNILNVQAGDMEDFVRRAGSAILGLGKASVSTEGEILNLALRLGAAGDRANFSAQEILAWATTLSDLGVRAESGGTAVSRVINEMVMAINTGSENLEVFAAVAGKSVDEFAAAFREDASGAVLDFIENLEQGLQPAGNVTKQMLLDMGLSGVRTTDIIGRLGDATDLYRDRLGTANTEWERAIALEEAFNIRADTVKSQLQILRNNFADLGIEIFDLVRDDLVRLIDGMGSIIQIFKNMDEPMQQTILKFALIAAAAGPLLIILGFLISSLGGFITLLVGIATPAGLAAIAISGIGAAMIAAFSPEIVGIIEGVIDALRTYFSVLMTPVPNIPGFDSGTGGGVGRTRRGTSDQSQIQPPTTVDPTEALIAALPPEVIEAWETLKATWAGIIDVGTRVGNIIGTIGGFVSQAFGPAFTVLAETTFPKLEDAFDRLAHALDPLGITWGDVLAFVLTAVAGFIVTTIALFVGLINGIALAIQVGVAAFQLLLDGVTNVVEGIVAVWNNLGPAINAMLLGDWVQANELMTNVLEGTLQTIKGILEIIGAAFLFFFGSILALGIGFAEGFLATLNTMAENVLGTSSGLVTDVLSEFQRLVDDVMGLIDSFVGAVTSPIQTMAGDIVGHSIIPDMVDAIIATFFRLNTGVFGAVEELVSGVIGKLTDLAAQAGELIASIFEGGGGKSIADSLSGASIDTAQFDAIKIAIEGVKLSLAALRADITLTAQHYMVGFVALVTAATTLLTQNLLLLWTTFMLGFTTIVTMLQSTWQMLVTSMGSEWAVMLESAIVDFTTFSSLVLAIFNKIRIDFTVFVEQMLAGLEHLSVGFMLTAKVAIEFGELILAAMLKASFGLEAVVGAFANLSAAAKQAAADVKSAIGIILAALAALSGAGGDPEGIYGSPDFKATHAVDNLAAASTKAESSMSSELKGLINLLGVMNSVAVPQGMTAGGGTTSNSMTIGTIVGMPMDTPADLMSQLQDQYAKQYGKG